MGRKLKELTIKDNFLFGAVMVEDDNCKELLEMILGKKIENIVVDKDKSIAYHPERKGVRLDVYAKDEERTHYNIEMQVAKKPALGKRSRYYQSQMDMELLLSGHDYEELPDTYVIFICLFDPFGEGKYCYTFEKQCKEDKKCLLKDGAKIIFLNTEGKNVDEVPKELVTFLKFVRADLEESSKDFQNEYVKKLQNTIRRIKKDRETEGNFMTIEELIEDERKDALKEVIVERLKELGEIPDELLEKIEEERKEPVLKRWVRVSVQSNSIKEFIQEVNESTEI